MTVIPLPKPTPTPVSDRVYKKITRMITGCVDEKQLKTAIRYIRQAHINRSINHDQAFKLVADAHNARENLKLFEILRCLE
jgi:hypothetical protein